ncbi:hypothetical protein SDC9_103419 [bioreactor metagenome]|uniref:Uncharacterized protein n=1 Tax=bioreactor metagenome TaxID=1076179 RepID=A0A645AU18_9ZZZZ
MSEHQRFDHQFFTDFLSTGLDHINGLLRTGNDQIQIRAFHLSACRVNHQFTIDMTDSNTGNRTVKRNIADA